MDALEMLSFGGSLDADGLTQDWASMAGACSDDESMAGDGSARAAAPAPAAVFIGACAHRAACTTFLESPFAGRRALPPPPEPVAPVLFALPLLSRQPSLRPLSSLPA